MKFIYKLFALIISVSMIFSVTSSYTVLAADVWSGYTLTGTTVDEEGVATITSTNGVVSSIAKSHSVGQNYNIEVSIKVDKYGSEQGMQITNGSLRLMFMLTNNALVIGGGSTFSYNIGTSWHDYYIEVTGSSAQVYIDGNYMGKTALQSNSTGGRLYFWNKSAASSTASMSVADFTYSSPTAKAALLTASGPATKYFYQDWTDTTGWQLDEPEVTVVESEETGKDVFLKSSKNAVVSSALKYYTPTDSFIFRFRLKVNAFNGETGAKLEYGPYRVFCYFRETAVALRNDSGVNASIAAPVGFDWHEYRIEVDDGHALFFMDNDMIAEFDMEAYVPANPVMSFWVKPSGGEPSMTVDWVEYTPLLYNTTITPLDKSEFIEGEDVVLTANYEGETAPDMLYYTANGVVIGSAQAPNYRFVWENAPFGLYEVSAIYGDQALSRTSLISIKRSFGGEIIVPLQTRQGISVPITAHTYHSHPEKYIESVTYTVNGQSVTQTNADENFAYNLCAKNIGRYRIQAEARDSGGAVMSLEDKVISVLPLGEKYTQLGLDYEMDYTVSGSGSITGSDGFFLLNVSHTSDSITYTTSNGDVTADCGNGDYHISVRSGIAELTVNGHYEDSFILPRCDEVIPLVAEGISGLNVRNSDVREIMFHAHGNSDVALNSGNGFWSLEFEKTDSSPETIKLYDGSYELSLKLDDDVTAVTAPLGGDATDTEVLCDTEDGRHLYRITSMRGIAMLYIDNEYKASFRLPVSGKLPHFTRSGAMNSEINVLRTEADSWTFRDDFEDNKSIASEAYWDGDANIRITTDTMGNCFSVSKGTALLNGFMENPVLKTKMKVESGSSGGAWLVLRHNSPYAYLSAGYNFASKSWEIRRIYRTEVTTLASSEGDIPVGEWFDIEAVAEGDSVTLNVNGVQVVSADKIGFLSHGHMGIYAQGRTVLIDNLEVTGDGRIAAGIVESVFTDNTSPEFVKLSDGSIIMASNTVYKSTDNGDTFEKVNIPTLQFNTIKLHNGNILAIRRVAGSAENTYWDEAWISKDDCATFEGPYRVETTESNRITMNNKLIQTENGRIFFCAGESGHGMEDLGVLGIYYSDDGGVTWHESENKLSIFTTGVNVQEGKITELPDGTLRCYMRTDRGFLYTSDSTDGGVSWSLELEKTSFPTVLCAFNIERDPVDKNTYYMIWQYDNTNENDTKQLPRWRTSLAVSYDGCKTWEYAADLSAYDLTIDGITKTDRYMNAGLRVFEDYIFADVQMFITGETVEGQSVGAVWKIDKNLIKTQKRIPLTYSKTNSEFSQYSDRRIGSAFVQSKLSDTALVFGELTDVKSNSGNLISADAYARYIDADLSVDGNTITLTKANVKAVFTVGSNEVNISGKANVVDANGETVENFTFVTEDTCIGAEGISAHGVAKAFGGRVYSDDEYVIISTHNQWSEKDLKEITLRFEQLAAR
ncbi:MAG: exo-alpha-sialidase [Clostridia bacterium]|nr:exo-alpha-sialidase [Clostridia bacterium]